MLYHVFKEQRYKQDRDPNDFTDDHWSEDHSATLEDQLKIFKYKHVNTLNTPDQNYYDSDVVGPQNDYIITVRWDRTTSGKNAYSLYQRSDVNTGDVIPTDIDKGTQEEISNRSEKHFKNNPPKNQPMLKQ